MPVGFSNSFKILGQKRICLDEVSHTEKKLWACIQSKGVVHYDVREMYHKACCLYEKLFLNDNELPDLEHIEYLLWRLHYKFIDEFRKRLSQNLVKGENELSVTNQTLGSNKDTVDIHIEGLKSFLSDATKFYYDLIRKTKRFYGLFKEPWFYKNDGVSGRIEQMKMHKCQFFTHRLYICLGDLSRYQELYAKSSDQQRNWCVPATYYLEAAKIYPDGGNPHNQLAVLATYIGDDFLALYHCIRSLAVKEPFQDALQNLMLLFERNRSIDTNCQSDRVYDFCRPSEWISSPNKAERSIDIFTKNYTREASELCRSSGVWTLIIKMTSFFFLESSLESFPSTFLSALRELEALLALEVTKLSIALESYRNMNLSKAGPYRSLQTIAILIFIIHDLTEDPQHRILKPKNEMQESMLIELALTVVYSFMGRFVDRCLMGSPVIYFPLLPSLFVFVEWLVGVIDAADINNEKCECARQYFFGSFSNLLNHLQENMTQNTFPDHVPLWEDYELRGFIPLSNTHNSLDFSSHWEEEINYKMKNEYRAHRIVQAAMMIAEKSGVSSRNWLFYDDQCRNFSVTEKRCIGKMAEEDEDIVFKPFIQHYSEPTQSNDHPMCGGELLQHASSPLVAQNQTLISHNLPLSLSNQPAQIAAGPPSLSSWIQNGDASSSSKTKGRDNYRKVLEPIHEETSDELLRSLSLSINDSSGSVSPLTCPSSCSASSLSAPLFPSNEVCLTNRTTLQPASSAFSSLALDYSSPSTTHIPHTSSPSSHSLVDHSSPRGPAHFLISGLQEHHYIGSRAFNRIHGSDTSSTGLFDPRDTSAAKYMDDGPPSFLPSSSLLHGLNNQQRPRPYDSLRVSATRPEPLPLLQHLKEREWQLQQDSPFTGYPYMQN